MIPGPPGTAFGYTLAGRLEQEGHPYLAAIQAGSAGLDTFGIDTSAVVAPVITGSLQLMKSAVVGAILKFGGDAFERLAQVQFMAVTGEEFGAALAGHAAEGAANTEKEETAAGRVMKSVRQDEKAVAGGGKKGTGGGGASRAKEPLKMEDFLESPGFGQTLKNNSIRTSQIIKGDKVYKAVKNIRNADGEVVIRKGDSFYIDTAHDDHLEVFSKFRAERPVVNLDGSINDKKTVSAKGRRF